MQILKNFGKFYNNQVWIIKDLLSLNICLKKEDLTFDLFAISEIFQKFYSNLTTEKKLPTAEDKFRLQSVEYYYKNVLNFYQNKFTFKTNQSSAV